MWMSKAIRYMLVIFATGFLLSSCKESTAHKLNRLNRDAVHGKDVAVADAPVILKLTELDHKTIPKADFAEVLDQLQQPEMVDGVFDLVRVKDGDTIVVSDQSGEITLRLLGIDTPEMRDSRPIVRDFAERAKRFVIDILADKQVLLGLDPVNASKQHLDRYGRLLAYVYTADDSTHVNEEIIRQGYGFSFVKYPCLYTDYFSALEREARNLKVGLWGTHP